MLQRRGGIEGGDDQRHPEGDVDLPSLAPRAIGSWPPQQAALNRRIRHGVPGWYGARVSQFVGPVPQTKRLDRQRAGQHGPRRVGSTWHASNCHLRLAAIRATMRSVRTSAAHLAAWAARDLLRGLAAAAAGMGTGYTRAPSPVCPECGGKKPVSPAQALAAGRSRPPVHPKPTSSAP